MTIFVAKLRRVKGVQQDRERLELSDGDFIDIDWSYAVENHNNPKTCAILLHGLEGSSQQPYILGAAKMYIKNQIDVCAVNYRSCSGELNRKFPCYHSGKTEDIWEVIDHVLNKANYQNIILHGFSLGANMALKLVGEKQYLPREIKAIVAISAPCDLLSSSESIMRNRNFVYEKNFNYSLIKKLRAKQKQFPNKISLDTIDGIKTLKQFDDVYTAKSNGFKNANDYYEKCSSLPLLKNISLPTYILNAQNDSFLGENCYPYKEARLNHNLFLETPKYGGHVGFYQGNGTYYSEEQAIAFVKDYI